MPLTAVQDLRAVRSLREAHQRRNSKSLPHKLLRLTTWLLDLQSLYTQSQLSQSLSQRIQTISKSNLPITCVLSLGLGSLFVPKRQPRRLKQLAILLAVRNYLETGREESVVVRARPELHARVQTVSNLPPGPNIAHTNQISAWRGGVFHLAIYVVYSPFLTLNAHEQLIVRFGLAVQYLLGDDFDELLQKWPEQSVERKQIEEVSRQGLSKYRRKAVVGEGFWTKDDETFTMAMYSKTIGERLTKAKAGI